MDNFMNNDFTDTTKFFYHRLPDARSGKCPLLPIFFVTGFT